MKLNISIDSLILMEGLFNTRILEIFLKNNHSKKAYLKRYSDTEYTFLDVPNKKIDSFEELFKYFNNNKLKIFLVATKVTRIREVYKGTERELNIVNCHRLENYRVVVGSDKEDAIDTYSQIMNTDNYHTEVISEITME